MRFDHGTIGNLKQYGTTYPSEYNLTMVTAPVYLFYSDNDPFVSTEVWADSAAITSFELIWFI